MRTVLARAMDEDPGRRYPTALAFASALEAAARGGRVTEAVTAVGEITDAAAPAPRLASTEDTEPDFALAAPRRRWPPRSPLPTTAARRWNSPPRRKSPTWVTQRRRQSATTTRPITSWPHSGRDHQERMLFDEEAAADMGFDRSEREVAAAEAPARLWEPDPEPIPEVTRSSKDRDTGRYGYAVEPETDPYAPVDSVPRRARAAACGGAADRRTLILGVLIGFAAGYWAGGHDAGNRNVPPRQPDRRRQPLHRRRALQLSMREACRGGDTAKPGGQAYSEQAVARPSATPPVVPDEGPRTAPREDRAAAAGRSGHLWTAPRDVDAVACLGDGERPMARPHTADADCDEVR